MLIVGKYRKEILFVLGTLAEDPHGDIREERLLALAASVSDPTAAVQLEPPLNVTVYMCCWLVGTT